MTIQLKILSSAILVGMGAAVAAFVLTSLNMAIAAPVAIGSIIGSLFVAFHVSWNLQKGFQQFRHQAAQQ